MVLTFFSDAFNIFDRDKDGFVDIKELIKVASTMGFDLDAEDLKACLDDVDEVNWKFESTPFF